VSLLGIDVGTTGCKAAAFRDDGTLLASAYAEYYWQTPQPGWAVLDPREVWEQVRRTIRDVAARCDTDPIKALAVSSLGEATVPVSADRRIIGPSILNFDVRGEEYTARIGDELGPEPLYRITGHALGGHFGLFKLLWVKEHEPRLYEQTARFLPWSSFVAFMLGAEPVVDYSLAARMLCFDVDRRQWSPEILRLTGCDATKLPRTVPAGDVIGSVSDAVAAELGLGSNVAIVSGCHDQCATAVGCGAIGDGPAAFGMGTYLCITPTFGARRPADKMLRWGLNTEHHAVPGQFVCFIYNQGGGLLRWYRDTFAGAEHEQAKRDGRDIYADLIAEIPADPSRVMVLPHFITTGPPDFITDSAGVLAGLRLETKRGEILKGILEATIFALRECVDALPETGIAVTEFRAAGGGSRSDAWLQICADILGRPVTRVKLCEAGLLGAAIIAGVGCGAFPSYADSVQTMVRLARVFEPDARRVRLYQERYARYRRLYPLLRGYLRELAKTQPAP
jgi:xylulokinase